MQQPSLSHFDAILAAPFGALGIATADGAVCGIQLFSHAVPAVAARNAVAAETVRQLSEYLRDARFHFTVPLQLTGSAHAQRVWQAMCAIPAGSTRSYGELATALNSSAQAVGGACGRNPVPVIVPCHRVVATGGALGGFMQHRDGDPLAIKRWLLAHEGARTS